MSDAEDFSDVSETHENGVKNEATPPNNNSNLDDLFGEESEDESPVQYAKLFPQQHHGQPLTLGRHTRERRLDDEELDSGDDLDRKDRAPEEEETPDPQSEVAESAMSLQLPRFVAPQPDDNEVRITYPQRVVQAYLTDGR